MLISQRKEIDAKGNQEKVEAIIQGMLEDRAEADNFPAALVSIEGKLILTIIIHSRLPCFVPLRNHRVVHSGRKP